MPDDPVMLKGSLVVLRDWTPEDVTSYREWLRPGHQWQAWDGPYFPRATDQEADQMCQTLRERIAEADWPTPYDPGHRGPRIQRPHRPGLLVFRVRVL